MCQPVNNCENCKNLILLEEEYEDISNPVCKLLNLVKFNEGCFSSDTYPCPDYMSTIHTKSVNSHSLAKGTKILTIAGEVLVENIEIGHVLVGRDVSNKSYKNREVTKVNRDRYYGKILEITLPNGKVLKVTTTQNILVNIKDNTTKWTLAKSLSVGDRILFGEEGIVNMREVDYNGYVFSIECDCDGNYLAEYVVVR
jgi:hypothetical protein